MREREMRTVSLEVPHGIVFVYDPSIEDALVPEYQTGKLAASAADMVYVGTQADVDGETEITLARLGEAVDPHFFVPLHVKHLEDWCPEGASLSRPAPWLALPGRARARRRLVRRHAAFDVSLFAASGDFRATQNLVPPRPVSW